MSNKTYKQSKKKGSKQEHHRLIRVATGATATGSSTLESFKHGISIVTR